MTIRVPGAWVGAAIGLLVLVGHVLLTYALNGAWVAYAPEQSWGSWLTLSGVAGLAGFLAGRWPLRTPRAPGLVVSVLLVAAQIGLGLGLFGTPFAIVSIPQALIQIMLALMAGILGTALARRAAAEPQRQAEFGIS